MDGGPVLNLYENFGNSILSRFSFFLNGKGVTIQNRMRLLSIDGMRGLLDATRGRRYANYGHDVTEALANRVCVLFVDALYRVADESRVVARRRNLMTILPRHVQWVMLDDLNDVSDLPELELEPIRRMLRRRMPDVRVNGVAFRMIVDAASDITIRQLRGGVFEQDVWN